MQKSRNIVCTATVFIMVLLVLATLSVLAGKAVQEDVTTVSGVVDLSGFNFDSKLACITRPNLPLYCNELYTPEDFADGAVKTEPVTLDDQKIRYNPGQYGTYRIIVKIPRSREIYGLSSYSALYAQRLFINGREYEPTGTVGKTAGRCAPKTEHYTVYFMADTDEVEIVIQFSNFVHDDSGGALPLYLGTQKLIGRRDAIGQRRVHILIGCTVTSFLICMGMFLFLQTECSFLCFALICLFSGLRLLIRDEKAIMLLFPDLPWRVSLGMEYLALIFLMASVLLYVHHVFGHPLHKAVLWTFGALCFLYAMAVCLTPPIVYTRFILWFEMVAAVTGVYFMAVLLHRVAKGRMPLNMEHWMLLAGLLIYVILSIRNIRVFYANRQELSIGLSETGMVVILPPSVVPN